MKYLFIIVSIILFSFTTKAQEGKGIFVGLNYYTPLGNLEKNYNSTIGFGAGYKIMTFRYIFNLNVGFFKMKPKESIVYYQPVNSSINTKFKFEDYIVVPIHLSYAVKINLSIDNSIYIGIDGGILNYKYSDSSTKKTGTTASLSPKIGFSQGISNLILTVEIRYNYSEFNTWNTGITLTF